MIKCNHSSENWDIGLVWYGSGRSFVRCLDCEALIGSVKGYTRDIPQEFIELKRECIKNELHGL